MLNNISESSFLTFEHLMDEIKPFFKKEYGEKKFNTIHSKITESTRISKFLTDSSIRRLPPGTDDYLIVINEITYFIFCFNRDTRMMASLLVLERWYYEVNEKSQILFEDEVLLRAVRIIQKTRPTLA